MKHWWIPVTLLYVLALAFLVFPLLPVLMEGLEGVQETGLDLALLLQSDLWSNEMWLVTGGWLLFLTIAAALLIFGHVETGFRRPKAQRPVRTTLAGIALAVAMLAMFAIWSVLVAIWGDDALGYGGDRWFVHIFWACVLVLWSGWYVVLRRFNEDRLRVLLAGSILELLIVLPCHIIVRDRQDCCAPTLTALGLGTGIAVMLMAFGPAILMLYRRRMEKYKRDEA